MSSPPRRIRFERFELDLRSGDLWKNGRRRALQEQPLAILKALLDRPGDIVGRDELCRLLWPSDTFVDFEHGLNAAVKRLRDSLGDDAEVPRFIETVPRRGYRWIAAIDVVGEPTPATGPREEPTESVPRHSLRAIGLAVGAGAALLVAVLGIGAVGLAGEWFGARGPEPHARTAQSIRFEILPPPSATVDPAHADARISPDGRQVVFVAWRDGRSELWLRPLGSLVAVPLAGTNGAAQPFWSPDSRAIGFHADGMLKKVAANGGSVQQLCPARHLAGASWGTARVIVFSQVNGLFRVPDSGGTATPIRGPSGLDADAVVVEPVFLPDGRRFLFRVGHGSLDTQGTYLSSLDGESSARLFNLGVNIAYGAGRIHYVRGGTLFAQAFDVEAPMAAQQATAVADDVFENAGQTSGPSISVSNAGSLVYRQRGVGDGTLTWFDREGRVVGSLKSPEHCTNPEISPDERAVAVECKDMATGNRDVWLLSAAGGPPMRVTDHPAGASDAVWSPDGEWVAFSSDRAGTRNLYRRLWRKAGVDEPVLSSTATKYPASWSRDGGLIAFTSREPTRGWDIWTVSLATREARRLVSTAFNDIEPQFSADGRWLAYSSDETGRWEVYLRPVAGAASARVTPISGAGGGSDPRWAPNGKELFYLAPDRTLMVVALHGQTLEASPPRALFPTNTLGPLGLGVRFNYAVASDGQRFLMSVADGNARSPSYVVAAHAFMAETTGEP